MSIELKRCPMCGAEEVVARLNYDGDWVVVCDVCCLSTAADEFQDVVVAEWNRRALEDELQSEINQLRTALYSITGWHNEGLTEMTTDDLLKATEEHRKLYAGTIAFRMPDHGLSDILMEQIGHLTTILAEECAEAERKDDQDV
jgi:hypothetical protein